MSSSAWAAPHFGLSGAPVFHIRAKCKARFSALPARALHKGPFRGQQSRSRKCGEVWDRRSGRIARFVQSGVNSTYRKRNGCAGHPRPAGPGTFRDPLKCPLGLVQDKGGWHVAQCLHRISAFHHENPPRLVSPLKIGLTTPKPPSRRKVMPRYSPPALRVTGSFWPGLVQESI